MKDTGSDTEESSSEESDFTESSTESEESTISDENLPEQLPTDSDLTERPTDNSSVDELEEQSSFERPLEKPVDASENQKLNSSKSIEEQMNEDLENMGGPNSRPTHSKRIKLIKHPGQKQGLYKISADGKYYYKVDESKQKYGLAIKGGALILNQLENVDTGVSFNDIYGSSAKPSFYVEYYWSYFKNKNVPQILKKARVKVGSGLLLATGNGRFSNSNYSGVDANESYTFLAFPNFLGLHLSFEVKDKQLVVPYVTGALEYLVGMELQNSNFGRTKFLGQLGAHVGGGLALSLGWLEETAKFDLDAEYGINQTYLTVELRQNIALQTDFEFTATFINAGIQFEF